ncbi:hypothetical protein [Streptomyces sp. CB02261]|nr:hypothetical protein [Streptomyces sp. CB02261]
MESAVAPGAGPRYVRTAGTDGVLLEWDASTEPDLERYDLYKGEFPGG